MGLINTVSLLAAIFFITVLFIIICQSSFKTKTNEYFCFQYSVFFTNIEFKRRIRIRHKTNSKKQYSLQLNGQPFAKVFHVMSLTQIFHDQIPRTAFLIQIVFSGIEFWRYSGFWDNNLLMYLTVFENFQLLQGSITDSVDNCYKNCRYTLVDIRLLLYNCYVDVPQLICLNAL